MLFTLPNVSSRDSLMRSTHWVPLKLYCNVSRNAYNSKCASISQSSFVNVSVTQYVLSSQEILSFVNHSCQYGTVRMFITLFQKVYLSMCWEMTWFLYIIFLVLVFRSLAIGVAFGAATGCFILHYSAIGLRRVADVVARLVHLVGTLVPVPVLVHGVE